jgi:seryl-tRNA synthetase
MQETNPYKAYSDALLTEGLFVSTGVQGVFGFNAHFQHILDHLQQLITQIGLPFNPEVLRFPPVWSRAHYACTDHLQTFPNLLGSIQSFVGGDAEHHTLIKKFEKGEDWGQGLPSTRLILTPAACYPLYPTAAGTLPEGGRTVDICNYVFRHEPSDDPARMQIFRQYEFVRLGTPAEALTHRDAWLQKGLELLGSLGLNCTAVVANDPFFGRANRLMKATQKEQELKYEIVVPICSEENPTAITSSNYHLDHFSLPFGIKTSDGNIAHTACIGFGLERIVLALFKTHGFYSDQWPSIVRKVLALP